MAKATEMNKRTNTKSAKEAKNMANITAKATTTLELTGTVEALIEVSSYLKKNGIECKVVKACEVIQEAKKEPEKASGKKSTGKNTEFDRKKYLEVAEKLGVKYTAERDGKEKVYGFARPVVYKAMEENKLTKKLLAKYAEELEEIARKKAPWFLEDEVEIEDEIAE